MQSAPKAVLIGRSNVGKSSLFNKLVEEQKSLVSHIAGTTRDRFEADCVWRGKIIRVVDTGGLDVDQSNEIEKNVVEQANIAITQADIILFLVDVNVGPLADDLDIARKLLKSGKPVIAVGNKADNGELRRRAESDEWKSWPLNRPFAISAKQGVGVGDLLDEVTNVLTKVGKPPADVTEILPMRICVLGEPNVGKSTLLNAVLGQKRFITAPVPHTTREPNDALFEHEGQTYQFIDTAGVRKQASRRKSGTLLEKIGVDKTLDTVSRADVALFVLDMTKEISTQERHLAGVLQDSKVSVIIIANKWDLVPNKTTTTVNDYEAIIRGFMPQLKYAPILFTSALTGQRAQDIFKLISTVFQSRFTQLSTDEARQFMSKAIVRHKPTRGKGVKSPKITSFYQSHINPPIFTLAVNLSRTDSLATAYVRFLENILREQYDFTGTPIRIKIEVERKSHTTYK
ncbi:MAG: ribosome biogenesis GTPase Der [Patescibacteria group bacterium]